MRRNTVAYAIDGPAQRRQGAAELPIVTVQHFGSVCGVCKKIDDDVAVNRPRGQIHLAQAVEIERNPKRALFQLRLQLSLVGLVEQGHPEFNQPAVDAQRKIHHPVCHRTGWLYFQKMFAERHLQGTSLSVGLAIVILHRIAGWLAGQRPCDVIATNPAAVIQAAEPHTVGPLHGRPLPCCLLWEPRRLFPPPSIGLAGSR